MSTPMSTINVCSGVLLNNDYKHTIWFDDHAKQLAYFAGKVVKTFSAYTYLRKSWSIKVEATMEQARTWSYLYFQNGNGKTYFYFINNIEYVNDSTVELFLEMDVMQTYLHEYTLHSCFVEREHSASDDIGQNLLEEGLELGELVTQQKSNVDMQELCVLLLTSVSPPSGESNIICREYDGVFSGLAVFAVESDDWYQMGVDLWSNSGFNEGTVSIWMYPKKLVSLNNTEWGSDTVYKPVSGTAEYTLNPFERPTTLGLDEYTPLNNKLLTYPYNMLYVTNNSGGASVYKYERFIEPDACNFRVVGAISPEGNTKLIPIHYNNQIVNHDEGLSGGNYPSCAWNQDVYKLWLAQNQHSQNLAMLTGGVQILAGVGMAIGSAGLGTLGGAGLIASGASAIAGNLAQRADMDLQPPQAKGSFSASVNIANEHQTFTILQKCVDDYHARIIDEYFSLYGYKTNRVKVPNRNVRENWTYTKTINCHVSGSICTEDLRKIQSIYDNGITFWRNGDRIGNYLTSVDGSLIMKNNCA